MNKLHRHLIAASLATLGLSLAHAGALAADSGLSRAEVRAELMNARANNTITPVGEIGDTPEVLAARETFNAMQTAAMQGLPAPARKSAAASQELDELVATRPALDAEDHLIWELASAER